MYDETLTLFDNKRHTRAYDTIYAG